MSNLDPIYSARKSSNHKLFRKHKISHDTNLHKKKTYTNIGHKIFEELVLSVSPLLKKHIRLGHPGIMDHSVDLSIPDLKKRIKKEWTEATKSSRILYKCITANTSVTWQHAAHTTDQLSSPNR